MNDWAKRTLEIVTSGDYLDRLQQQIYPHEDLPRDVPDDVISEIRQSFDARDDRRMLGSLLKLGKFPYNDSYVGVLRSDPGAIERNPETVKRICGHLYSMGVERVIMGITAPKEANTRRGNQFRDWTKRVFKFAPPERFRKSTRGIVMLDATEAEAKDFCNTEMSVGIAKRPDMVAKSGMRYVIGEAKFLSAAGGNQARGFEDGMKLANNPSGHAHKVFIFDGMFWFQRGSDQFKQIEYSNAAVFSALLLRQYLESISG